MSVDPGQFRRMVDEFGVRKLIFGDSSEQTTAAVAGASPILSIAKEGTTTKASDTTLADDPHLFLTGIPAAMYAFDLRIRISQGAITGGFKFALRTAPINFSGFAEAHERMYRTANSAPAGSAGSINTDLADNQFPFQTAPAAIVLTSNAGANNLPPNNSSGFFWAGGVLRVPQDDMSLFFQWAQNVSSVNNTGVSQESCMWLTKMADLP